MTSCAASPTRGSMWGQPLPTTRKTHDGPSLPVFRRVLERQLSPASAIHFTRRVSYFQKERWKRDETRKGAKQKEGNEMKTKDNEC